MPDASWVALRLTRESMRACKKKEDTLELMIGRLKANQVLVSRSVQHYRLQRLTQVKFSGMTIRDAKVTFIFLAGHPFMAVLRSISAQH